MLIFIFYILSLISANRYENQYHFPLETYKRGTCVISMKPYETGSRWLPNSLDVYDGVIQSNYKSSSVQFLWVLYKHSHYYKVDIKPNFRFHESCSLKVLLEHTKQGPIRKSITIFISFNIVICGKLQFNKVVYLNSL